MSSEPPTNAVLASVRAATRPLHAQLERHMEGRRLLGAFDRHHYARFLMSHEHLHRMVARLTTQHVPAGRLDLLDWPECERLSALMSDLRALGAWRSRPANRASEPAFARVFATVHADPSPAFAVGMAYVAEGSFRGNRQILAALDGQPGFAKLGARTFLERSAARAEARWPAMLSALECYGTSDPAIVRRGAVAGFLYYRSVWDGLATIA
ncbi:MAG: biliverdin-producing heme oxygenase [Planctomycetota bacterium]